MKLLVLLILGLLISNSSCQLNHGPPGAEGLVDGSGSGDNDNDNEPETYITVDAAIGYTDGEDEILCLFVGVSVHILVNKVADIVTDRQDFLLSKDFNLQAAFIGYNNQDRFQFYGDKKGYFFLFDDPVIHKGIKYGPARKFIRKGGPDAAGKLGDVVYFFKGCQMAIRYKWNKWGKPKNVRSIGLPCNVDAAWSEKERMVILKGDHIWVWNIGSDKVVDSGSFNEQYQLFDEWALAPKPAEETPK